MPVDVAGADDGDVMASAWAATANEAVGDLRVALLAATSDVGGLLIARHVENPPHQVVTAGSKVTLDWIDLAGTTAAVQVSRRVSPTDPAAVEYWTGSKWQSAAAWIAQTATVVSVGGWDAADTYFVAVTARNADGEVSNELGWSLVVLAAETPAPKPDPEDPEEPDDTPTVQRPVMAAVIVGDNPVANSVTTTTLRVGHTGGTAPTQLRVRRHEPDNTVEYWTGTAWQTAEAWMAWAPDQRGGMSLALTGFVVGASTLTVTARVKSTDPEAQWSVARSVTLTRSVADAAPVIADARTSSDRTAGIYRWRVTSGTQAKYAVVRRVGGTTYQRWNGSSWVAAVRDDLTSRVRPTIFVTGTTTFVQGGTSGIYGAFAMDAQGRIGPRLIFFAAGS